MTCSSEVLASVTRAVCASYPLRTKSERVLPPFTCLRLLAAREGKREWESRGQSATDSHPSSSTDNIWGHHLLVSHSWPILFITTCGFRGLWCAAWKSSTSVWKAWKSRQGFVVFLKKRTLKVFLMRFRKMESAYFETLIDLGHFCETEGEK